MDGRKSFCNRVLRNLCNPSGMAAESRTLPPPLPAYSALFYRCSITLCINQPANQTLPPCKHKEAAIQAPIFTHPSLIFHPEECFDFSQRSFNLSHLILYVLIYGNKEAATHSSIIRIFSGDDDNIVKEASSHSTRIHTN